MNSSDFKEQFDIAGVSIIPKMKSCGKENCGACPHGPFWYVQAPGYWTVAQSNGRMEVYLGRAWGSDDLLEKVAPLLALRVREPFIAWIAGQLDRERLAEIGELLKGVEREREGQGAARVRAERVYRAALKELADEESALKREAAGLSKKLGVNGFATDKRIGRGKMGTRPRRVLAPVKKKGAKR